MADSSPNGKVPRVRTYVEGLDEKIEGGIPKGQVVLVAGEPGTLKSSFAFHVAYHNALHEGRKALYVTMEQSRESLLTNMAGLGMDIGPVANKLSLVDIGLIRKNLDVLDRRSWIEILKMYARNMRESQGYEILVLDSLQVLETLSEFAHPRNDLFQFFEWIRGLGVTCLIILEVRPEVRDFGTYGEDYLSDGIVHLMMSPINQETVQRRIRVVKMRSTNHSTNLHSLLLEKGRFRIARVIST
jgi:KaiC/GvpD/RAD55 family RecA-like ATPase